KRNNFYFCILFDVNNKLRKNKMIQRIQTVFIFLAALLAASLLKLKFAELLDGGEIYQFTAKGIMAGEMVKYNGWPVMGFIGLITMLHLIVIFLYRKRILQMRLLGFTIILLLGLFGIMLYFMYSGFDTINVVFKIPMIFPLIAVILDYLAIRAIGKDEALVRSLNRIR
ncbi:MAG: DUF4293 domain-containing protein, partial [Prolixibacteraceae bacterium]|nr:DUF4293 domain-containing protein [Prolixibacteraceae bacterium]